MTLTAMQEKVSDLSVMLNRLSERDLLRVEGIIIGIDLAHTGGDLSADEPATPVSRMRTLDNP